MGLSGTFHQGWPRRRWRVSGQIPYLRYPRFSPGSGADYEAVETKFPSRFLRDPVHGVARRLPFPAPRGWAWECLCVGRPGPVTQPPSRPPGSGTRVVLVVSEWPRLPVWAGADGIAEGGLYRKCLI